jgi:hypothetical protein
MTNTNTNTNSDMPEGFGPTYDGDPRMRTADGFAITNGIKLYNYYDCEWVIVQFDDYPISHNNPSHEYWDGWFRVVSCDPPEKGGRGRYSLNGERMCTKEIRVP